MSQSHTSASQRAAGFREVVRLAAFALLSTLCATALDLAVSMRTDPGALGELRVLGALFAVEAGILLPACFVLLVAARIAAAFVPCQGAREGALLAAAIGFVGVPPLSTLLGLEPLGVGLKSKLYTLSLLLAALWLVVPCTLLAARVLPRIAPGLRRLALVLPLLAAAGLLAFAWQRTFPPRQLARANVAPKGPKQIVLITVDTLRPDYLSTYEPRAQATPHLDAFGRDALVFEQAESVASWTKPSLASLLTGLSPAAHRVLSRFDSLDERFDTLAERLLAAGYQTGVVAFNPFLYPGSQLTQGFVDYAAFPRGNLGTSFGAQAVATGWLQIRQDPRNTPEMTERAQEWLREHAHEPFFFWLHYFDPHQPYEPPEKYMPKGEPPSPELRTFVAFKEARAGYLKLDAKERDWIRKLYAGEVQQADEEVGKVLAELKTLGLYDDALIVFTSDHGEEFWEHGGIEHGHTLYEELLHVPLMIKLPKSARKGRVAERVSLAAVYPTVLEIAGVAAKGPDGLPRWPSLLQSTSDRGVAFIGQALLYFEDKISVLQDDRKYIRSLVTGHEELFDLASDPGEQHPITQDNQALIQTLQSALREALRADGATDVAEVRPR